MRRVVVMNRISIDGFFAGPDGEIDWFVPDPDVDRALHGGARADTVLLGRFTYQMFASYWPDVLHDPRAPEGARMMARELNEMTKVVFSTSLPDVTWENSKLLRTDLVLEVSKLKQAAGSDIIIFGSGTLVQQLAPARLIEDYFLIVTPVVLGRGKPLFADLNRLNLTLADVQVFNSGNVLLHYRGD